MLEACSLNQGVVLPQRLNLIGEITMRFPNQIQFTYVVSKPVPYFEVVVFSFAIISDCILTCNVVHLPKKIINYCLVLQMLSSLHKEIENNSLSLHTNTREIWKTLTE